MWRAFDHGSELATSASAQVVGERRGVFLVTFD
jgi:hypothetical protein